MDWAALPGDLLEVLIYLAIYIVFFLGAKFVKDLLTPYRLIDELANNDNAAVGTAMGGYLIAVSLIFIGAVAGPSSGDMFIDVTNVTVYCLLGLLFLNASRYVLDRVIFRKFCNLAAIAEGKNTAVGAVRCGMYLATGAIAAAAVFGVGGGPETALAFFLLGQATLVGFTRLYDVITPYDLEAEVESGNVAAGVGFGGSLVALGVVISHAAALNFVSWVDNLGIFLVDAVLGTVLLMIGRVVLDRLVLLGHDLNDEIAEDGNVAAGLLEAAVALGFALVIVTLL